MAGNEDRPYGSEGLQYLAQIKEYLVDPWVAVIEARFQAVDARFEQYVQQAQESANRVAQTLEVVSGTQGYVPRAELDSRFNSLWNTLKWIITTGIAFASVLVAAISVYVSHHP